jgi:hypothetical protein
MKEVNPDKVTKSRGISINVEIIKNRGLNKALFGEEERGFSMSIRLR